MTERPPFQNVEQLTDYRETLYESYTTARHANSAYLNKFYKSITEPGQLSWYSDWMRGGANKNRSSVPCRDKQVSPSPKRHDQLWDPPNALFIRRDADHFM